MPCTESSARLTWQLAVLVGRILSVGRETGTEGGMNAVGVGWPLKELLVECDDVIVVVVVILNLLWRFVFR